MVELKEHTMMSKAFFLLRNDDNRAYVYLAVCSLLVSLLVVSPVLNSGYTNDDSLNSLIKGNLEMSGQGISDYISHFVTNIFNKLGRFYPLASISPLASSYIDLGLSKALTLVLIAVDLLLFACFIRVFTGSSSLAILSILLVPLSMQFRLYHDPVLGYTFLLQLIVILLLSSFILLTLFTENGKKAYFIASIAAYCMALMCGEVTYPFFLVHLFIIYFKSGDKDLKKILRMIAPFLLVTGVVIAIPITFRLAMGIPIISHDSSNQYVISPNAAGSAMMLVRQTISAIPLSYYIIDPNGIFGNTVSDIINNFSYMIVLLSAGYFLISMALLRRARAEFTINKIPGGDMVGLLGIGVLLLVLPGVLISLLPKYQSEVIWGFGYIYGYISCFGTAAILLFIVYTLAKALKARSPAWTYSLFILVAVLLASISMINYSCNAVVVEKSNQYWEYPRSLAEESMKNGLFSGMESGSVLLVDSNYPWDQISFYYMGSGVALKGVCVDGSIRYANVPGDNFSMLFSNEKVGISGNDSLYVLNRSPDAYYLRYYSDSKDDGYAILARADEASASGYDFKGIAARNFSIYVRCATPHPSDYFQQVGYAVVTGTTLDGSMKPDGEVTVNEDGMRLISEGDGWKLFMISYGKEVDARSLSVCVGSHYVEPF